MAEHEISNEIKKISTNDEPEPRIGYDEHEGEHDEHEGEHDEHEDKHDEHEVA